MPANNVLLQLCKFPEILGDEDPSLAIQGAINRPGHEKPLKGADLFPQEGLVRDFFLDDTPFIVRKNHQIAVPVCDDETVVVFLGEHLTESRRKNDSPFVVDGVVILTPEDGH
jgi:hypothetical protein